MTPIQKYFFDCSQGQNFLGFSALIHGLNVDAAAGVECDLVSGGRPDGMPSVGELRSDSFLGAARVVNPDIESAVRIRPVGGDALPVRRDARISNDGLGLTNCSENSSLPVDPDQPICFLRTGSIDECASRGNGWRHAI